MTEDLGGDSADPADFVILTCWQWVPVAVRIGENSADTAFLSLVKSSLFLLVDFCLARVTPGRAVVAIRGDRIWASLYWVACVALPACPLSDAIGDHDKSSEVVAAVEVIADGGYFHQQLPSAVAVPDGYIEDGAELIVSRR